MEGKNHEEQAKMRTELESIGNQILYPKPARSSSLFPQGARSGGGAAPIEGLGAAPAKSGLGPPPPGWKSDEENWAGIQGALGSLGKVDKAVRHA